VKNIFSRISIPVFVLIMVGAYHLGTTIINRPVETYILVMPVTILTVVFALLLIVQELWQIRKKKTEAETPAPDTKKEPMLTKNQIILLAGTILYIVFILIFGVKVATVIISISLLYLFGVHQKILLISITVGLVAVIYFLFEVILLVPFPNGLLG
jgi:small-conductance mechanosensitive channel